jgi:hypothetical protein
MSRSSISKAQEGTSVFGLAPTTNSTRRAPPGGGAGSVPGVGGGGRQLQAFGSTPSIPVSIPSTDFDFGASNATFNKPNPNPNNNEDEAVEIPAAQFYDKKSSFFDSISADGGMRVDRGVERKVNLETFGEVGGNGGNGGFGGRRGRGGMRRGGYGQGQQGQQGQGQQGQGQGRGVSLSLVLRRGGGDEMKERELIWFVVS